MKYTWNERKIGNKRKERNIRKGTGKKEKMYYICERESSPHVGRQFL
jgi:hypothetical protein